MAKQSTARQTKKNPRRKHAKRRKKNMSTGAKIAIAAGVVLVGIPVVLITAGALGFRALVRKAEKDMPPLTMPMSGREGDYKWTITQNGSRYDWTVYQDSFGTPLLNGPMHSGTATSYNDARNQISNDIVMRF